MKRLDRLQARRLLEALAGARGPMKKWTAYVEFNHGGFKEIEEIDVSADTAAGARAEAQRMLDSEYQPGGKIVRIELLAGVQVWSR